MRLFIIAIVLCVAGALFVRASNGALAGDFKAFYCAAHVAGAGADPYRAHPLYECESQHDLFGLYHTSNNATLPAPLPGYALALLWPLTLLPFDVAAVVFTLALLAAIVLAAMALARTSTTSFEITIIAFALSIGLVSIPYGEIVPICIAALCVAALWLERGEPQLAAIAVACGMVEPHVMLPAAVALFLWVPKARFALVMCALVLATLSFAILGLDTNIEYLTVVLPAQTYSDIAHGSQFGLSALLYQFGMSERLAVVIGQVSYVVAAILGVALAGRLARRLGTSAIILVPVAIGLVGGPYVHLAQIAAAIPAAIILVKRSPQLRMPASCGLALMAVPWQKVAIFPLLIPCAALVIGVLIYQLSSQNLRSSMRAALAATVLGALIAVAALLGLPQHASARPQEVAIDASLAQASWSQDVREHSSNNGVASLAAKIPTWFGLLLVLFLTLKIARDTKEVASRHSPIALVDGNPEGQCLT